ncbi:hypothetical protein Bca4012_026074 [Brassica carinata]
MQASASDLIFGLPDLSSSVCGVAMESTVLSSIPGVLLVVFFAMIVMLSPGCNLDSGRLIALSSLRRRLVMILMTSCGLRVFYIVGGAFRSSSFSGSRAAAFSFWTSCIPFLVCRSYRFYVIEWLGVLEDCIAGDGTVFMGLYSEAAMCQKFMKHYFNRPV